MLWYWSWNSNILATSCEELTHWKRPSCWEGLGAGGEGDDRGWDGWMASPTWWTLVWVNSGSWTGRPGVLQFMGSQRVGHDWATELNWSFIYNDYDNGNEEKGEGKDKKTEEEERAKEKKREGTLTQLLRYFSPGIPTAIAIHKKKKICELCL